MNELRTNIRLKAPSELKQNVLQRIKVEQDSTPTGSVVPRRSVSARIAAVRWIATAAAVAAVVIIGVSISRTSTNKPTDTDIAANADVSAIKVAPSSPRIPARTLMAKAQQQPELTLMARAKQPHTTANTATTVEIEDTTSNGNCPQEPEETPLATTTTQPEVSVTASLNTRHPTPYTQHEQQLLDRLDNNRDLVMARLADEFQQAQLTRQHILQAAYDNIRQVRQAVEDNLRESLQIKKDNESQII